MFYSDLLKGNENVTYDRKGSFPLVVKSTSQTAKVGIKDGTIEVSEDIKNSIFNTYCVEEERKDEKVLESRGIPYTFRDVEDSEDNPLIVVRTSAIRIYDDIPTYVEVLYVDSDSMLVMLVYGACDFQFVDESFVALQRCNDINLENRKSYAVYTPKKLLSYTNNKTKGGFDKSYQMTCPLTLSGSSKNASFSSRFVNKYATVFNQKVIDERVEYERAEVARKKELAAQKKKELEERLEIQAKERKLREEAKRREEIALKSAKASRPRKEQGTEITGNASNGRSKGAMAFLDALK